MANMDGDSLVSSFSSRNEIFLNRSQTLHKNRYQILQVISNVTGYLYFVTNLLQIHFSLLYLAKLETRHLLGYNSNILTFQ